MPARPTCAALIARVQDELGPTAAGTFSTDQIQTALDRARADFYRLPLTPVYSTPNGASLLYLDYYAQLPGGVPLTDWEGALDDSNTPQGYLIQRGTWEGCTADFTADWLTGHFASATDHRPPLYLTGRCFDFWTVVGDLLTTYARAFMEKVNFSSGVQRVDLSNQHKQILDQAQAAYKRRRRRGAPLTRGDSNLAYPY